MKIGKLKITKDKLNIIKEDERFFFLQILNILNDINCFQKLILYSLNEKDNLVLQEAQNQITLSLYFVLNSKIKEGWELIRKDFLNNSGLSANFIPRFSEHGDLCFNNLKKYFGRKNLIFDIRNKIGSHYDTELLKEYYSEIRNDVFHLYVSETNGETFSTTSHMNWESLFNSVDSDHEKALGKILDDTLQASRDIGGFIRNCIEIVQDKYFDDEEFQMIDIPEPIAFEDIRLNFYSKQP